MQCEEKRKLLDRSKEVLDTAAERLGVKEEDKTRLVPMVNGYKHVKHNPSSN